MLTHDLFAEVEGLILEQVVLICVHLALLLQACSGNMVGCSSSNSNSSSRYVVVVVVVIA